MIDIGRLFGLHGRVALITGAAEGMGREIARYYAAAGAAVMLADINADGARIAAEALSGEGAQADFVAMDQADEAQIVAAVDATVARFGKLDLLVNNAAIQDRAFLAETGADLLDRLYAINLRGPFLCLREAARAMKAAGKGGAIVNIGSLGGVHPMMEGLTGYNAMKAAVHAVTRQAALELGPDRIRVNAVLPGPVPTEGSLRSPGPLEKERLMAKLPLPAGRLGEPGDVAAAAVYLASNAAAFVTGHLLVADGGILLR